MSYVHIKTKSAPINLVRLKAEINADAGIPKAIEELVWNEPDVLECTFDENLLGPEEAQLDVVLAAHDGTPLPEWYVYCLACAELGRVAALEAPTSCPTCGSGEVVLRDLPHGETVLGVLEDLKLSETVIIDAEAPEGVCAMSRVQFTDGIPYIPLPPGVDTTLSFSRSYPLKADRNFPVDFNFGYCPGDDQLGNVLWEFEYGYVEPGTVVGEGMYTGGPLSYAFPAQGIPQGMMYHPPRHPSFPEAGSGFVVPGATGRFGVSIRLRRKGSSAGDTYPGTIQYRGTALMFYWDVLGVK